MLKRSRPLPLFAPGQQVIGRKCQQLWRILWDRFFGNEVVSLNNNRLKAFAAIVLILGLFLSPFRPASPVSAGADKIHPNLLAALETQEFVQVLIKLGEQQDPHQAAQAARNMLAPGASPVQAELKVREAVVNSLQSSAASSQGQLLSFLDAAAQKGRARNIRSFYIVNMIYAEVDPDLVRALARRSDVSALLPNTSISQEYTATQTTYNAEYWNLERINLPAGSGLDGSGVVVGIIDTGVDWNHPDLKERWRGSNPGEDPSTNWFDAVNGELMPYDDDGHGTLVTGIIAGANGSGIAPRAQWIAAKAFDEYGEANSAWLLSAGEYMLAPLDAYGNPQPHLAPDIINNSWGRESGLDEWYRPMVQAWRAAGILPVFAGGNVEGIGSVYNPANYPESLAVAAIDQDNRRSSFSAEGPSPYPEIFKPELAAPGESILSTRSGGGYALMSGTSAATPHVTGAAALLLSYDPALTPEILEALFKQTATPLTDSDYPLAPNHGYGYGLINVGAALAMLQSEPGVITGRVSTTLTGLRAPEIKHIPVSMYYTDVSMPVTAEIRDKLGVAKAEVTFLDPVSQLYTSLPMTLIDGDSKSGLWTCWLPYEIMQPPVVEYTIAAENRAGIDTVSSPYLVGLAAGIIPPAAYDFGEFPWGWIWDGNWDWGETKKPNPFPVYGDALFGTRLGYTANTWSSLYAPPLDLSDATGVSVRFDHWYDLAPGDTAQVFVSTDFLETWEIQKTFTGTSRGWKSTVVDLSAWDNWPTPVIVGFDIISGEDGGGRPGWFIDRFQLLGTNLGDQSFIAPPYSNDTIMADEEYTGSLPLEAVVTVVETGQTVRTGYADGVFAGSFLLLHPATAPGETITLRVEARGYYSWEQEFTVAAGEVIDINPALTPLDFSFQRVSGGDRFATAVAISQEGWETAETVFLARGDNYADALAGVPLAYALDAPVLLSKTGQLPESTRQELIRLEAKTVYILGGAGAISPEVEAALADDMGLAVVRISGANRYSTAAEIARYLGQQSASDTAVVVYGNNFPDALAAAPFAAAKGMPILLSQVNVLPQETQAALQELGISKTIVAGGSGVISDAVFQQLPQPSRIEGRNRYFTAVALADYFAPEGNRLYLATGRDFADAISGAVLAAKDNSALLLVGEIVSMPVSEFILDNTISEIMLLGGAKAVPDTIIDAIRTLEPQPN